MRETDARRRRGGGGVRTFRERGLNFAFLSWRTTQTCSDLPQISFSNHTHFGPVPKCLRTEAMPINNSCKCSKFGINGLRLHVTNFRRSCMSLRRQRATVVEKGNGGRAAWQLSSWRLGAGREPELRKGSRPKGGRRRKQARAQGTAATGGEDRMRRWK